MERMLPLLALGLLVAGFCPAVLCHPNSPLDEENPTQENQDRGTHVDLRLASTNVDFAFSLYKQLVLKAPDKNVIFSPLSISTVLAFLSLGARNTTLTEILKGLKFNLTETSEAEIHQSFQHLLHTLNQSSDELQLSMGNAMFVKEQLSLLDRFTEDAKRLYGSEAFATDFQDSAAAKKLINDYVKNGTRGKITDLIKDLDPQTMMVLVNYIFFKAKWEMPFDPQDTHASRFYLSKKKWVMVPMMSLHHLTTPYFRDEELSCTVVELKYTGNASALLILPDQDKMEEVEAMLLPETLKRWRDALESRQIDELYLPKFSISRDYNLEDILLQLGIEEAFTSKADLSGITGARNLAVSQVVHKAVLDVSEEGTEASAATAVKITLLSAFVDPKTIVRFNRPFLMIIVPTDTQNIYFMSKVTNPKQA
ncbi:alpha-1-antichymotrypsin isoform X2 [Symphalangus syndactylus]|nr:alpha-1-antichymotrypsin isoform X2 [Symphalangus syndactylus]XP_055147373.1 alpha-1-antichymotrypsin isoform X2 [Symphalangus syndactylus]XP_055147374.1 alpha-1-antichymotrypsin isoform X2 [Symphalangus syndactylus]